MTGDHIDDATVEALLTGRRAAPAEPQLTALTAALRDAGTRPPQPSPRLAAMLATGVFTENGDLPATAASNVHAPASARQVAGLPKWRRRKMAFEGVFGTLLAKFAALGFAAKAAAVTTVAVASVGAVGAAGELPAPLQHPFDRTVHAVVPGAAGDEPAPEPSGSRSPEPRPSKSNFGSMVSQDAKDGGVDGRQISQEAKNNGRRPEDAGKPSAEPSESSSERPHGNHPSSDPDDRHKSPEPGSRGEGHSDKSKAPGRS
jgi:hypothetical protein